LTRAKNYENPTRFISYILLKVTRDISLFNYWSY